MVVLHSLDAKAAAGVTRYSRELAGALREAGEPVRELRIRPFEVPLGRRRVGGFVSMRLQSLVRPLRKGGLLHSTYHYAAHPRCDLATVHDVFPETRSAELGFSSLEVAAMRRTTLRLLHRGAHFVAVSQATRSRFLDLYPGCESRLHVAAPGISSRFQPSVRPRPHPAFRADRFNVLCVADLNPRKRFDWLLQAALDLDDPNIHVVHAGPDLVRRPPWAEQRRRELPLEKALGARLTRLGRLDDEGLLAAYQSADLLVLPSLDEGFGFPPLEAMACGTPAAVTDLGVFRETLGGRAQRFTGSEDLERLLERAAGRGHPTVDERWEAHDWVMRTHGWPQAAGALRDVYVQVAATT